MGLFALPASRIPANLLPFLLRATLLETKLVMIFLHFVASLRFKSRFLPFLVNRAHSGDYNSGDLPLFLNAINKSVASFFIDSRYEA